MSGTLGNAAGNRGWKVSAEDAADGKLVIAAPLTKGSATGKKGYRDGDADTNYVPTHVQGGSQQDQFVEPNGVVPTLALSNNHHQGHHQPKAVFASGVRRLTPIECERLQGLPGGWTQLDDKTPDSRRYSALGDAVTANVAEWIGRRLAA